MLPGATARRRLQSNRQSNRGRPVFEDLSRRCSGEQLLIRGGTTSIGLAAAAIGKRQGAPRCVDEPERGARWIASLGRGADASRQRSERFADQCFACRQQRLSVLGVQSVGADPDARVRIIDDLRNVTIFAITRSDVACGGNRARLYCRRRSLRDTLPIISRDGPISPLTERFEHLLNGFSQDRARMDSRCR